MTTKIDSLTAEVAADFVAEIQEADQLLRAIAQENRSANHSELVYFEKNLRWDRSDVRRELRRMFSVLSNQAIAGSPAGREAAAKEAETASAVLAKESPKITEQIEKLQAKLRGLENDARLSAKRVEDQAEAVAKLRELCPKHVADSVREARQELESSLMREIQDATSRIHHLECCTTPSKYPSADAYIDTIHRSFPDGVTISLNGRMIKKQLSPAWVGIKNELEIEKEELIAKIAEMQPRFDTELAKIEEPLSYYADAHNE